MRMTYALIALALSFPLMGGSCAGPERIVTKEVLVPVPTKAPAPDWLAAGYKPEALPKWLKPDDPAASSCIARDGEVALQLLLLDLTARDEAWQAWAR